MNRQNVMKDIELTDETSERKLIEKELIEKNKQLTEMMEKLEQAQKQLIQQEKLACIGQLAAGVAHEINNPLGYICSNFELFKMYSTNFTQTLFAYKNFVERLPNIPAEDIASEIRKLSDLEKENNIEEILNDHDQIFADIEDGLERIREIVAGLKAFSRSDRENEFAEYDLNESIRKILVVAKNNIKYHANVVLDLGDIPRIRALGNKIDQVLLNIIINASDAIKERKLEGLGSISITTDMEDGYVRCRVEDNGIGIDKEHVGKIFDPFFTTKPLGKGTGIGLSVAYDIIVNQHGGQIYAESSPMAGARFTVLLPAGHDGMIKGGYEK
jgi:two-component system NtrC family sensor kinase